MPIINLAGLVVLTLLRWKVPRRFSLGRDGGLQRRPRGSPHEGLPTGGTPQVPPRGEPGDDAILVVQMLAPPGVGRVRALARQVLEADPAGGGSLSRQRLQVLLGQGLRYDWKGGHGTKKNATGSTQS